MSSRSRLSTPLLGTGSSSRAAAHPERRVRGLFIAVLVVLTIFAAQLVRLQGFDTGGMAKKGADQRLVKVVVPASRGVVTDASGAVLADSVERFTLVADQKAVSEYKKKVDGVRRNVGAKGAAADVAPILQLPAADIESKLTGDKRYVRVATEVTPVAWRAITRLGIGGLSVERTVKRSYPQGPGTASILGFMTNDGTPAGGVEQMLHRTLKGTNGLMKYEQAPNGQRIPTADDSRIAPVPGKDVRLTIDSDIQWFAHNALAQAVPKAKALSGNVVVQEVSTGRLVAVANYPTFDPGDLTTLDDGSRLGNKAFEEVFEPGSTAKVITMGAALQEKVVTPTTAVTVPNRLKRSDKTFRDSEDHETLHLTATGVLAHSSNIGTMLIGEKMPPTTFLDYVSKFGFGHGTGVGFPGESPGIVPKTVGDSQRYTVLFGQGLSVNAVQAASVFQTIANGGRRVAPSLVAGTTDGSGTFSPAPAPASSQILTPDVARTLAQMMQSVVSGQGGTAKQAAIPGYLVAGKTGTANRYDSAKKAYNGYTASFIGFAPADKPRYVVAVTVQRPLAGSYGGVVAGPIFADVMKYVLEKYQVPPSGAAASTLPLTTTGPGSPGEATPTDTSSPSGSTWRTPTPEGTGRATDDEPTSPTVGSSPSGVAGTDGDTDASSSPSTR